MLILSIISSVGAANPVPEIRLHSKVSDAWEYITRILSDAFNFGFKIQKVSSSVIVLQERNSGKFVTYGVYDVFEDNVLVQVRSFGDSKMPEVMLVPGDIERVQSRFLNISRIGFDEIKSNSESVFHGCSSDSYRYA